MIFPSLKFKIVNSIDLYFACRRQFDTVKSSGIVSRYVSKLINGVDFALTDFSFTNTQLTNDDIRILAQCRRLRRLRIQQF